MPIKSDVVTSPQILMLRSRWRSGDCLHDGSLSDSRRVYRNSIKTGAITHESTEDPNRGYRCYTRRPWFEPVRHGNDIGRPPDFCALGQLWEGPNGMARRVHGTLHDIRSLSSHRRHLQISIEQFSHVRRQLPKLTIYQ